MADQLQLRGGTTAEHATFTGALREVTVDTDKDTVVVHDNATAGGHPLAKENLSNVSAATAATKLDGQTVKFGLGAAATPSVTFNGDLNTGVYSPGADQVAISTGGSGRLFINSSGNIGVGTSTPGSLITAATSADGVDGVSVESPSVNGIIRLRADGTNGNAIRVGGVGAQGNTLRFLVGGDVERMRLDSSGRLGVGTSSPGSTLETKGSSVAFKSPNNTSRFFYDCGDGTDGQLSIYSSAGAQSTRLGGTSDSFFGGRLGIGSNAPINKLVVSDSGNGGFEVAPGATDIQTYSYNRGTSAYITHTDLASAFIWNNGTAERARIDSSGRLLVGTSSALSTNTGALLQLYGTGGSEFIGSSANNNPGAGDPITMIRGMSQSGSSFGTCATIAIQSDAASSINDYPGRIVFSTTADGASSPTERMRISQNGKTKITAAAGVSNEAFSWENSTNTSGAYAAVGMLGSNCNNTSSYHYIASTGGSDKYYIYGNGTTGTPSDINLKKNIETTRDGYLEDLCQLRVVKYNWNEQEDGEPKELGVIAQELEQVFPGLIQQGPEREDGSSYKAVKTSVLPFMLLKALQEAAAKIETLEARLTALESA